MVPDSHTGESTGFFTRGMILLVAAILIVVVVLAAGIMQAGQGTVVPPAECSAKTLSYVNTNLVSGGSAVEPVSVSEIRGLYEIRALFQSEEIVLYTTKDCALLFTNIINMSSGSGAQPAAAETAAPVKSARPSVDLYVMSFCPYGTQAETVMKPVIDLLGSQADIRLRYITTVTGSTAGSVDSLHGPPEAQEDLQQVCINRYYPEKFWEYLTAFNKACYPSWQNAAVLASCRQNTTASLGIDQAKIDTCAGGEEGIALLKADEAASAKDRATASPMLFINGVKYSGARTPEAFKQAICNSFETPPSECSTVLSSTSASASGSC